jgi:hypothetical protein
MVSDKLKRFIKPFNIIFLSGLLCLVCLGVVIIYLSVVLSEISTTGRCIFLFSGSICLVIGLTWFVFSCVNVYRGGEVFPINNNHPK